MSNSGENGEKLNHSYIAGRNAKWHHTLENGLAVSFETKHALTI